MEERKQNAFDIYVATGNGKIIKWDTVFYTADCDVEYVTKAERDNYPRFVKAVNRGA